jgi:hypothetical protein
MATATRSSALPWLVTAITASLTLTACSRKEEEKPAAGDAMMASTALEGALDIVAWPGYIERG